MLQNLSYRYYSLYNIIKRIGFELINYAINLNIVSFSVIFIEFNYVFLSNNCYFESIKLIFFSKKNGLHI